MSQIPNIKAPTALPEARENFEEFLGEIADFGGEFIPGEMFRYSWMLLQVGQDENGPRIMAPVFGKYPFEYIEDCSAALNLVAQQRLVAESFSVSVGRCTAIQAAIVVKDLNACSKWTMTRIGREGDSVSGWSFGAEDSQLDPNVQENLELRSLWDLYSQRPELGEFCLLPPGMAVALEAVPRVMKDGKVVQPLAGSYFAQKFPDSETN